jgi:hypothetical protein
MSNDYRMSETGVILEVWAGRISMDEFFEHERRHLLDPKFPSAPKVVVDITGASFDEAIGEKEIQRVVNLYQNHRDKVAGARVAIIAAKDFERASLYGRLAGKERINVIVFHTLRPACVWLGLNETEVRKDMERVRAKLSGAPSDT